MPQNTSARVFVVDDELIIAITTVAILRQHGYQAQAFFNAREALEAAQTTSPDLLITDVMMPGMSGVDLAITMNSLHPACKTLLISGQADVANLLDVARQAGHTFDLRSKPIPPADLLSAVHQKVAGSGASYINLSPNASSEAHYTVPRINQ